MGDFDPTVATPVLDAHCERMVGLLRDAPGGLTRQDIARALAIPPASVDHVLTGKRERHRRFRVVGAVRRGGRRPAKLWALDDGEDA